MKATPPSDGFIKFRRSVESRQLLRDPLAFALLALIASRARWHPSKFSVEGLEPGEALLGDHKNYRMTRQQYRSAIKRLIRWEQITVRTSNQGTIARLQSNLIFDINMESDDRLTNEKPSKNQPPSQPPDFRGKNGSDQPPNQPPNNQQTTSEQPLTKNERKENNKKKEREYQGAATRLRHS
jgi:hypothetical protein